MGHITEYDLVLGADEDYDLKVEADFLRVLAATGPVKIITNDSSEATVSAGVAFRGDPAAPWRRVTVQDLSGATNTVKLIAAAGRSVEDSRLSFAGAIQVENGPTDFVVYQHRETEQSTALGGTAAWGAWSPIVGTTNRHDRVVYVTNTSAHEMLVGGYRSAGWTGGAVHLFPGDVFPWVHYRQPYVYGVTGPATYDAMELY